jgi:hypothetical protein
VNIEQKNTLFVVALILLVLLSVGVLGYTLTRTHVEENIEGDLERSHKVFVEAEKNAFEHLLMTARAMAREPSLVAAMLTKDTPTVRGMLEDLYPRPGMDLLAIYLEQGPYGVVGESSKPHLTSQQVLRSKELLELVRSLTRGADVAYGNALVSDSLLRVVAIPIENPLGGRVGVLEAGEILNRSDVIRLKELVRAEIMVFRASRVLGLRIRCCRRHSSACEAPGPPRMPGGVRRRADQVAGSALRASRCLRAACIAVRTVSGAVPPT